MQNRYVCDKYVKESPIFCDVIWILSNSLCVFNPLVKAWVYKKQNSLDKNHITNHGRSYIYIHKFFSVVSFPHPRLSFKEAWQVIDRRSTFKVAMSYGPVYCNILLFKLGKFHLPFTLLVEIILYLLLNIVYIVSHVEQYGVSMRINYKSESKKYPVFLQTPSHKLSDQNRFYNLIYPLPTLTNLDKSLALEVKNLNKIQSYFKSWDSGTNSHMYSGKKQIE
jgi:hypothetical protein